MLEALVQRHQRGLHALNFDVALADRELQLLDLFAEFFVLGERRKLLHRSRSRRLSWRL